MRRLLLLRPEPGLSASMERARAMGLDVIACPLFRVEPVEWSAPNPASYDALLITSANAVRHGGYGLEALKVLPVHAVGAGTAAVAQDAGFRIASVGHGNAADLLATLSPTVRLLHVAGEDRSELQGPGHIAVRTVYRSVPVETPGLPSLDGLVVAVHSPRAAARLAELGGHGPTTFIAAISATAAAACGNEWARVEVAEQPNDPSLLALAAMLCHTSLPA